MGRMGRMGQIEWRAGFNGPVGLWEGAMAGDYGASLAIACGAAGGKVKPVLPWPDL